MNFLVSKNFAFKIDFFTKGHERSLKAKKNILASFIIKGFSILISLLLVPMTINYVNPTRYGIWITLSSIIGWFSFFDIGFGNGLRNKFAEAIAKGDKKLARVYVSTTYAVLSIVIGIVLILFLFINPFLNWTKILNTPKEMIDELRILALIVFVFFCIQFVMQLINTILTADQKPAKASFFNLLGSIFSLIVLFVLTKTTQGSLVNLGITLGFAPILVVAGSSIWFYNREYKDFAPSLKFIKFSYAKDLMSLGIKFFLIQIAAIVLYQTSNIIIAQLFGPAEVTPYNIAYKYFSIITMIFSILVVPFWSAFTEAWIKKDIMWIRNTMKRLKLLWVLLSILVIIMLIFSNLFYRFWVGEEIFVPKSVSIVLAAYVIINAWNGIYCQFLNGVGKIKLQLYSGIWGMVLNIPMAVYFGKHFGISGVIFSTVLLGIINMPWTIIQYNKIINNKGKGIWSK